MDQEIASRPSKNNQPHLFVNYLEDMLDSRDALVVLADTIPWDYFNQELSRYYSDKGRPANLLTSI